MKRRKIKNTCFNSKITLISKALVVVISVALFLIFFAPVNAKEKITITEFSIPTTESSPVGITVGPDGNYWFTEQGHNANKIGRITPDGKITEFPIPTNDSGPFSITSGPDGNLWFTEAYANRIGRITTSGEITEFVIPTNTSDTYIITSGPDGNLWFTESSAGKIGRITPNGNITEFLVPVSTSYPYGITSGPDGSLWFTELNGINGNRIGRITTSGYITEFAIPVDSTPLIITSGPDGNLWFTDPGLNKIGRITTNGNVTEFPIPTSNSSPFGITLGPDSSLWFTEQDPLANKIGKIRTNGTITEFIVPTGESNPTFIASGPDGNVWFTENNVHKIGRVNLSSPKGPDRDFDLLSPFNNGVAWTVFNGYLDNRDQSKNGCGVATKPLDHCRNQLFGLDMVPDQESDKEILAPANGKVSFRGELEGGCIGLRVTLDNGLNLNVCHFAAWNVSVGDRVLRGKVLGTRSTPHVHLSLDDRYRIGNLCPGQDRCFLPIPFDGQHTLEGVPLNPDPNGETVILPYPLCDQRNAGCRFKVGFQQYQGLPGMSSNIAIP
ncbi:MAG: hypothetical protein A3H50_03680 [Candidatus Levybacteria bacterium RIFCSPLOWO2_02_FULL_37_10]|nr:MAG: hypothetical protein A2860_01915 [Candidatus Levybacteria bacterium RIFCSPHIGHO2_01_FULL_37_33]OGH43972.1 MAG: hypothetical protein A3H50_03680 [Candidatus Levybacteria bacterium RIFCSPLOWO2_02_FULL_37_10]